MPPASGNIAPSSAYVSAPARVSAPPSAHTATMSPGCGSNRATSAVVMKTAVPRTEPIVTRAASPAPSPRTSPSSAVRAAVGSMRARF